MNKEQFAKCPFCGKSETLTIGKASDAFSEPDDCGDPMPYMHTESYSVVCDSSKPDGPGGCGASGGYFPSEHEAVAAWNRRAEVERLAAQAEPAPASVNKQALITKLRYMGRQYAAGITARGGGTQKHYLEEAADEIEMMALALSMNEKTPAPAPVGKYPAKALEVVEPVACLVNADLGAMVWPISDIGEAGTYCDEGEFPELLYSADTVAALQARIAELEQDAARGQVKCHKGAVVREFENEIGNRIKITIEGPTSTSENILTPMEATELRRALIAAAPKETP